MPWPQGLTVVHSFVSRSSWQENVSSSAGASTKPPLDLLPCQQGSGLRGRFNGSTCDVCRVRSDGQQLAGKGALSASSWPPVDLRMSQNYQNQSTHRSVSISPVPGLDSTSFLVPPQKHRTCHSQSSVDSDLGPLPHFAMMIHLAPHQPLACQSLDPTKSDSDAVLFL